MIILWKTPLERIAKTVLAACCLCKAVDGAFEAESVAKKVLSPRELSSWNNLKWRDSRRRQWILGRIAAKVAVHHCIQRFCRNNVGVQEIEIVSDRYGKPVVESVFVRDLDRPVSLSIAHSGDFSVSISGTDITGIGIDIEHVGSNHEGLEEGGFSPPERSLTGKIPPALRGEWLLRFWCAKEAAAKALGKGMMGNPHDLTIEDFHLGSGEIEVTVRGSLVRGYPELEKKRLIAASGRDDALVYATALI